MDDTQQLAVIAFALAHREAGMHGGALVTPDPVAEQHGPRAVDPRLAAFGELWAKAVADLVAALDLRSSATITADHLP